MGCYTGALYTTKPTNIAELKTSLLSIWNDLPQEFTEKAILSFRKRLIVCCCSWQTLWTLSLNTERAADIHYWNVWSVHEKAVQFDSLLLNIQDATVTACSLEKNELWSLNCCICWITFCYLVKFAECVACTSSVNAVNLVKNLLQFQRYRFFPRGLLFWRALYNLL